MRDYEVEEVNKMPSVKHEDLWLILSTHVKVKHCSMCLNSSTGEDDSWGFLVGLSN